MIFFKKNKNTNTPLTATPEQYQTPCYDHHNSSACWADHSCEWGRYGCVQKPQPKAEKVSKEPGRFTSYYIQCSYGEDYHQIFINQWAQLAALSLTEVLVLQETRARYNSTGKFTFFKDSVEV